MERRSDIRHRTVFCPAFVRSQAGLDYVFLRNVSHDGASFCGSGGQVVGDHIEYCVGDLAPVEAIVKWVDGRNFGVSNISSRIEDLSLSNGFGYRSARLPLRSAITLYLRSLCLEARLRDLSQSGACIAAWVRAEPGELVSIVVGGVCIEAATVKWTRGDRIGLKFARPLDQATMCRMLGGLQGSRGFRTKEDVPDAYHTEGQMSVAGSCRMQSGALD